MKDCGFETPLYVLPFDHRGSFETGMFGGKSDLTFEQTSRIAPAKRVLYDGFKTAVADGLPKENAAADEQFAAILHDAAAEGYITVCPVEQIGQEEFEFEYGENSRRIFGLQLKADIVGGERETRHP